MEDTTNAGTLTYTSEKKGFRYVDGDYTLTGDKIIVGGAMTEVQNGNIQKDGSYYGYYNVRMDGGEPKLSAGDIPLSEYQTVMGKITELVGALQA